MFAGTLLADCQRDVNEASKELQEAKAGLKIPEAELRAANSQYVVALDLLDEIYEGELLYEEGCEAKLDKDNAVAMQMFVRLCLCASVPGCIYFKRTNVQSLDPPPPPFPLLPSALPCCYLAH